MTREPASAASGIARRAVLAASAVAALAAAVPNAAARNRKPPLAFVKVTITEVAVVGVGAGDAFRWRLAAGLSHPASNFSEGFLPTYDTPLTAGQTETRASLVAQVQEDVSQAIQSATGQSVPPDRIAVVLL
jgi:hypothetical protein